MDYKKAYLTLFNKVTDIIGELQDAQVLAENTNIDSEDPKLTVLPSQPEDT